MRLNILFLCDKPAEARNANTISDHITAFEQYSKNKIWTLSHVGDLPKALVLEKFDAIIVHYSVSLIYDYYMSDSTKKRLSDYKGLKILFVQDEYRQINKLISEIKFINFDILFTCFPNSEIENIYPAEKLPHLKKINNLTGYIPESLKIKTRPPIKNRRIDVGYRGRKIPFWLGELAYEKYSIVEHWTHYTKDIKLKTDISYHESDRIYGDSWIEFLLSCKTTLGVESGASVMDFTGKIEQNVSEHNIKHPDDPFEKIQKLYFAHEEGKFKLNQISPRCFEAIALKTVLVLYEGEYSGILEPNRHYIELKKDFSNIHEVLSRIQDDEYLQAMADIAYQEIINNPKYSYKNFIAMVDNVIQAEFITRNKTNTRRCYNTKKFHNIINPREEKQLTRIIKNKIKSKLASFDKLLKIR